MSILDNMEFLKISIKEIEQKYCRVCDILKGNRCNCHKDEIYYDDCYKYVNVENFKMICKQEIENGKFENINELIKEKFLHKVYINMIKDLLDIASTKQKGKLDIIFNMILNYKRHYCNHHRYLGNGCCLGNGCESNEKKILNINLILTPSKPEIKSCKDCIYNIYIFRVFEDDFQNVFQETHSIIHWLFENYTPIVNFSICSSLNIYDDSIRQIVKRYYNFLKSNKETAMKNYNFRGKSSLYYYLNEFNTLLKYYNDDKTLKVLDKKENPHIINKRKK